MHDWTFVSLKFEWEIARAELIFTWDGGERVLVAEGIAEMNVPHHQSWGPSVSVNDVTGPIPDKDGIQKLEIEMQTGDVIKILARNFQMPAR